mgnify:CR=1 FL=1
MTQAPERQTLEVQTATMDRRDQQRYRFLETLRFRCYSGPFLKVKAIDLSLDGLSLECSQQMPLGATCQVLYSHPSRGLCWVEGTVLYNKPFADGFHVGLQLQFRSMADRLPYQQLILSLAQEGSSKPAPGQNTLESARN